MSSSHHDIVSFGCGDGENGRCNIGGLVGAAIRTMPELSVCVKPCVVKSELIRVGELTRMRSGDKGTVVANGLLPVLPFNAGGICGCGRRTVGVTGKFVMPMGGECVLMGGEFSPKR